MIPFLLASIVFHKQWLIDNLHANHPLFISPLWTSVIFNNLSASVLSGTGRNSRSLLTATGVPPHILLANEIAKVYSKLEDVKTELIDRLDRTPDAIKGKAVIMIFRIIID